MSLKRAGTVVDVLYVGVQPRTIPVPGEKEAKGLIYSITKDKITTYGAPYVTLDEGTTYKFVIDTPGHPFYITTDPNGGGTSLNPVQSMIGAIDITPETSSEKGNVGIERGTLIWTPSRDHSQMKLYYQCNYHRNMGNAIFIKLKE